MLHLYWDEEISTLRDLCLPQVIFSNYKEDAHTLYGLGSGSSRNFRWVVLSHTLKLRNIKITSILSKSSEDLKDGILLCQNGGLSKDHPKNTSRTATGIGTDKRENISLTLLGLVWWVPTRHNNL